MKLFLILKWDGDGRAFLSVILSAIFWSVKDVASGYGPPATFRWGKKARLVSFNRFLRTRLGYHRDK
jgi:hypothetical protein